MLNVNLLANPRDPNGLAVQISYDPQAVSQLRLCLGLSWDKNNRVWSSTGPEVLLDMERFAIQPSWVSGEARQIAEEFRQQLWNVMDARVEDYHDELYGYQKQGSNILAAMPNSILADEMGTGKSKQSLDAAITHLGAKKILVIAPKTLCYNWYNEVELWHPSVSKEVLPDLINGNSRRKGRDDFWNNQPQVVICNYEKLLAKDWPMDLEWDVVICDEATKLKTATTATYKAVRKVFVHAKCAWCLTGTPLEIRLTELYNILCLLRPAILGNYMRFKDQHLVTDWAGGVVGAKNIPLLRERISPFMLRRTKAEVLPMLPPKLPPQNYFVKLSPAEDAAYKAFTAEFNNWLSEHGVSGKGNPLTETLRMRQFCCTPWLFTEELGKGSKFEAVTEYIDEWPGRVVVFSYFEEVIALLHKWWNVHPEAVISGKVTTNKGERIRRAKEFSDGRLGKVFLSTDAGGMGINLVGADLIVHYDQGNWNPKKKEQREDRLHRIGQHNPVHVLNAMCIDTIDYGQYQLYQEELQLSTDVVDGSEEHILRKLDAPRWRRLVEGRLAN